jgi:hypothetical protein
LFSKTLTLATCSSLFLATSTIVACSTTPDPSPGTGGATAGTGGGQASGGVGATSGGAPATGGGAGSGGVSATGGSGSGGVSSTGGAGPGTGGGSSTGGSGTGGGNVGPGIADIPPAPGPADVPQPAGTPTDITVRDWAGFPAAVTYSFDDNDGSQLDRYAEMHAIGGRYTYYLVSSNFGVAITDPRWHEIYDDGNEIGNHTTNHSCGTSQIDGANTALEGEFGEKPTTLAAPNGDDACQGQAAGRVFINREVGPASPVTPLDGSDPFALNCYIPAAGQAADQYNANINSALSGNGWVIYVIHGINPGTSHTFQPVSWDGLKAAIEYAKENDVWIDTMENIGSYWLGQKAFAAATSQTTGDSTTWTWTLPAQFPPDKYLRVTVDGGTLTQGGAPLTWDPHGYYEIALDELSVTLAP